MEVLNMKKVARDNQVVWEAAKSIFSSRTFRCACGEDSSFDFRMTEVFINTEDPKKYFLVTRCKHCKKKIAVGFTQLKFWGVKEGCYETYINLGNVDPECGMAYSGDRILNE